MATTLYVIPGSHPSVTAALVLQRKGIPYKRRDLIPVISKGILRAARFPGVTVPALKLDGRRIQGSREIARELDRISPNPRSFPPTPEGVRRSKKWRCGATSSSRSRAGSSGGR